MENIVMVRDVPVSEGTAICTCISALSMRCS
jgi:hypothetical protein